MLDHVKFVQEGTNSLRIYYVTYSVIMKVLINVSNHSPVSRFLVSLCWTCDEKRKKKEVLSVQININDVKTWHTTYLNHEGLDNISIWLESWNEKSASYSCQSCAKCFWASQQLMEHVVNLHTVIKCVINVTHVVKVFGMKHL